MGASMAKRLVDKGKWNVYVWNRNADKTQEFHSKNPKSHIASSPANVLSQCEIILIMVTDAKAVHSSILSEESKKFLQGKTIVQFSTISSTESILLSKEASLLGATFVECPVLGSLPAVEAGTLKLMLSGPLFVKDSLKDLLEILGVIIYIGETIGKSSVMKLALNQLIAAQMSSFAVSLALLQANDLSVDIFSSILRDTAIHSKYFDNKVTKMEKHDYSNPTFSIDNLAKDVSLIQDELKLVNLQTCSLDGIKQLCDTAIQYGFGQDDIAGLIEGMHKQTK